MQGYELDFLKPRDSTNCDLEVMTRKVAGVRGDIYNTDTGLHRVTVSMYDSIKRRVDRTLAEVCRHLEESFDHEARSLQ